MSHCGLRFVRFNSVTLFQITNPRPQGSDTVLGTQGKRIDMDEEDGLKALLERAKELKEISEKLIKESNQLMDEYEALKLKRRGRARTSSTPE